MRQVDKATLLTAMQRWGFLEDPAPDAALRWIDNFLEAYDALETVDDAFAPIAALRAEACVIPAIELERLRTRQVLFFLDTVGQYVDHQPELRALPLAHDIPALGEEFGIGTADATAALRMALTGSADGPALDLLFPLLGHDRILIRIGAVNSRLLHGRGLEPIRFGPDGKPFEPIRATSPQEEKPGT